MGSIFALFLKASHKCSNILTCFVAIANLAVNFQDYMGPGRYISACTLHTLEVAVK